MEFKEGDRVYKIVNGEIDKKIIYKINEILPYDTHWHDGYFFEIKAIATNENNGEDEEIRILFSSHLHNFYEIFLVKV